jgi:hypothetical protein
MIRFFPELYPNEILYSLFARYHLMSKNKRKLLKDRKVVKKNTLYICFILTEMIYLC